jgi:hypothetical protein
LIAPQLLARILLFARQTMRIRRFAFACVPTPDPDGGSCVMPPSSDYHPYLSVLLMTQTAPHQGDTTLAWASIGYSTGIDVTPMQTGCVGWKAASTGPTTPNAKEVHESGGTVSITGGTHPVQIAPSPVDDYVFVDNNNVVWPGGTQLGVDVAGACDVAASHFDIEMPKAVTALSPSANATVSRAGDLVFTWTPGAGGMLVVHLTAGGGGVDCAFDPATGSGTIPKILLQTQAAGAASYDLQLYSQILTKNGGRSYRITAGNDVLGPDGTRFPGGKLTLQ